MQRNTTWRQVVVIIALLLFLYPRTLHNSMLPADFFADHSGRFVNIPSTINKVYTTTEEGLFLVYALAPDSVLGWNRGLSPELEFAIHPQYHSLPTLGSWNQKFQTIAIEKLLALEPDLVIHYAPNDEANLKLADEIQETLGIPTILVDNSLKALPDTLRLLGQLLGKEVRGQALATYVEKQLGKVASFQALQQSFQPIPVHIVSPFEQGHFDELLSLCGMVEMPIWNNQPPLPDLVLIMPHSITDPYRTIEQDGHKIIYQIPSFPLNWLEPGSIFALLGLEWLHSIAYPTYPADLAQSYTAFMEVFFEVRVTPELLAWTFKRSGISY